MRHVGASAAVQVFSLRTDALHSIDDTSLLDRVAVDPTVRFGKPTVRGTRISVGDILGHLAAGTSESQILRDFPQLTREDIRACLAFAAERERRSLIIPAY